jgi:hypothetical protein
VLKHLNESQRANVAANLANVKLGDNQHGGSANLQTQKVSQSDAAKRLNVSTHANQRLASEVGRKVGEKVG